MTTLEAIISSIESAGNRYAMRFEPHVYERTQTSSRYEPMIELARVRNKCSRQTACVIVATSWSKFQIMGFNLYDPHGLNYPDCVGAYMGDDMAQAATFRAFCEKRNIYFTPEDLQDEALALRFAQIYNGADEYAKKIAQRLAIA
jgi:hypothetical protein